MECGKKMLTKEQVDVLLYVEGIKHLNNNKLKRRRQVHGYFCRACRGWHTTTIPTPVFNK